MTTRRTSRASRASWDSGEQLRVVVESMAAMVTRCDREGRFLWVSQPYAQWLGLPRAAIVGQPIAEVIGPEAFAAIRPHVERVLAGERVEYEAEIVYRRLGPRWVHAVHTPTVDAAGVVDGWVAVVTDVHERRRTEEALRASDAALRHERELLRTIIDAIPVMITMYEPDTKVLRLNREFERVVGWSSTEAAGVSLMDACYPDPAWRERVRRHMEASPAGWMDVPMRTRDGRDLEASWANLPLSDGTQIGIGIDITERKAGEAALAAARDELARQVASLTRLGDVSARLLPRADLRERLLDVLDLAIELTRADMGHVQLLDPASGTLEIAVQRGFGSEFLELFGRARAVGACAVALARRQRVLVADVANDPLFAGTPARDVLQRAGVRAVQSTPLIARSGEVLGMLSTHFRRPGRPGDHALHLLDVLARQAADFIERVGTERERERLLVAAEAARREAEAGTRARDEFLAMLGHELRNPLGAITSAVAVLKTMGQHDEVAAQRALDVISRQLGHLARFMDDLLDAGRVIGGKVALVREPVDLGAAAERALATIQAAGRTRARHVVAACEPVWVEGDVTRIEQIVTNLLTNAVKFTPAGGSVELRVRADGDAAVLVVTDTGVGMEPDLLPRVFDLFVQGSVTLDRSLGGLGVGLTLVRKLVELHGGTVSASSGGPGQGSTFTVRLPRTAAPVTAPARAGAAPPRRRLRVLVVEDNADSREMMSLHLRFAGHDVSVAEDGPGGVDAARAFRPDVAIVDVGLPGLDGYEVARRIRAQADGAIALLALTGYGQPEDRRRALEAGFDGHLTKPVDPRHLLDTLDALTASRAARPRA